MLSAEQIAKAVADLQNYDATKKMFRAVADEKCIVLYGSQTCGKDVVAQDNARLLTDYEKLVYNFDDPNDLKLFLKKVTKSLVFANAHYSGQRKLNLPVKNLVEIFMQ